MSETFAIENVSKNDKYHTFGLTTYYEVNKPKTKEKSKKNL